MRKVQRKDQIARECNWSQSTATTALWKGRLAILPEAASVLNIDCGVKTTLIQVNLD